MSRAVLAILSLLLVIGAVVYVFSTHGSQGMAPASEVSAAQPEGTEADCPTPGPLPPPEAAPPPPPPGVAMIVPCGPGENEAAAGVPKHP